MAAPLKTTLDTKIETLPILAMVYQRFVHGFFIYGSGPHAGLAEIALPAIAPGSTIMPGKINPSMAMLLEQACQHLSAIDQTAQYSYNEYDFDQSYTAGGVFLMTAEALELLGKAARLFAEKCLRGLTVLSESNQRHLEGAASHLELLEALLGTKIRERLEKPLQDVGLSVKEAAEKTGVLSTEDSAQLLDFHRLAIDGVSMDVLNKHLKKF